MHMNRLAAVAAAVTLVAGCSSGGAQQSAAPSSSTTQKVALTYWNWVPGMDKVVAVWNTAHPDIQVTSSTQAGGDDSATKFLTAAKAGNPPDLVQAEYQAPPPFGAAGAGGGRQTGGGR